MKVLVVGASGLVGSHCMTTFAKEGYEVIGTHFNFPTKGTVYYNPAKAETRNYDLNDFKPDVIIQCAALTNVDYCEEHPAESELSTIISTKELASYCIATNTKLVYISTDYVFDGSSGPYSEDAIANPINVYGKHKLEAERITNKIQNYIVARITNVYGEEARDKNFIARLLSWLRDNDHKDLLLPIDQFATPIYAGDIAEMLYLLIKDKKTGIYHLSSTDYYNRYILAQKVKSFFPNNASINIKGVQTTSLKQAAQRPLKGGLLNTKFVSEYPEFIFTNIDSYLTRTLNGL